MKVLLAVLVAAFGAFCGEAHEAGCHRITPEKAAGSWTRLTPKGTPPKGDVPHAGAAMGGHFFISGETMDGVNSTVYYDSDYDKWVSLDERAILNPEFKGADMDEAGGSLYLFGGLGPLGADYVNTLLVFKPHSNQKWNQIAVVHQPGKRHGHTNTIVGGLVFIFGGWDGTTYFNDMWMFDTTALDSDGNCPPDASPPCMWIKIHEDSSHSSVPMKRNGHSTADHGGQIILFGGFSGDVEPEACTATTNCHWLNDVWTLKVPATKTAFAQNVVWEKINPALPSGSAPVGRYGHSADNIGGSMYVFGGMGKDGPLNDLWEYSFEATAWVELKPKSRLPTPRYGHVCDIIGGSMYIFGGVGGGNELWRFDPSASAAELVAESGSEVITVDVSAEMQPYVIAAIILNLLVCLIGTISLVRFTLSYFNRKKEVNVGTVVGRSNAYYNQVPDSI